MAALALYATQKAIPIEAPTMSTAQSTGSGVLSGTNDWWNSSETA